MSTLLLIRHGETSLNVARVLQPADTPLSARGQAQAAALARRLRDGGLFDPGPLRGVLASDLLRARQTAAAIAEACGLAVTLSPLLQERNYGDWRGRPYDSLGFDPLSAEQAPPGGESQAAFGQRCAQAWALLCAEQARCGGPLAVVTHGLVLREWLARGPLPRAPDQALPQRLANTSLTIVDAAPPHRIRLLDNSAHLDATADGPGEAASSLSGG